MRFPSFVRLTIPALALAAATLSGGCREQEESHEQPEIPRNVRVLELKATDVVEYLEITGPVTPVRGAVVSAEESGTVSRVPHDKGDRVAAGGVMVELDRRLLAAELDAAKAGAELAEYNADKTRQLHEAGKVSRLDLLRAESDAANAVALREVARRRWERSAVAAPFAGVVTDRYVEPGELVAPGTPVARIIDPSRLKLTGSLTESEVPHANVGDAVDVKLDGHDGLVAGEITWTSLEADGASGKFKVEIEIPNADHALRSGVVGRARMERRRHVGVFAVPRDAVISETGADFVYVVEDEHAVLREIALGSDQGLMVLVESGLRGGETLVVRGQRELVEGSLVKITETTDRADGSIASDPAVVTDEHSRARALAEED